VEINGGHIPEESFTILGIFELNDTVPVLTGRDLDGDTTTVVVGDPLLAVVTSGAEGLHLAGVIGDGPQVQVGTHVVDNLKTTTAVRIAGLNGTGFAGANGVREGRSGGSEKAGKEDVESHDGRL